MYLPKEGKCANYLGHAISTHTKWLITLVCLLISTSSFSKTLIYDDFNGNGDNLQGASLDTFDSAIGAAGGSNTWVAEGGFKRNGSLSAALFGSDHGSAYINLGSYINSFKGHPLGYFELSARINKPSNALIFSRWVSIGFYGDPTPNTGQTFVDSSNNGVGTITYNDSGAVDAYAGPRSSNRVGGVSLSGYQTFTIRLDLRNYDAGANNFGTVSFLRGSTAIGGTRALPQGFDLRILAFSRSDEPTTTIDWVRLTQIDDTTKPVITVSGSNPQTVEVNGSYSDAGATASDNEDGNLTSSIVTTGSVNTSVVGTYTIRYNVSDAAGNAATQKTRTVNVVDTTKPSISLVGDNPYILEVGSSYTDPGANASDNYGVSNSVSINDSAVNTNVLGDYTVKYNVTDNQGNAANEVTRTVRVVDTTKPVISLNGSSIMTIELGTNYVEAGATASDNYDTVVNVIIGGDAVNSNVEGDYTITYNAVDSSGNTATQKTRVVTVGPDVTKPVITILGSSPIDVEAGTSYSDAGAIASDNVDTNLAIVVGGDTVDVNTLGKYVITYSTQDTAGNFAEKKRRAVNVVDTIKPVITVLGDDYVEIEVGDDYDNPGASASDSFEGDLTDDIVITGTINPNTAGTYKQYYNVSDSSGNAADEVFRTVVVLADATPPIISLTGEASITLEVGTAYTDAGATASDNIDGNITDNIVIVNPVDVNTVGDYTITYNVSDEEGNAATQVTRAVSIVDTTKPVITLLGSNPLNLEVGTTYTDPGANALDNYSVTNSIAVDLGTLDTSKIGSYSITYNVSDDSGNAADEVVRTVNVEDTTKPVISLNGSNSVTVELGDGYVELGATASDNHDNLVAVVVGGDVVNTNVEGVYNVTFNATDNAGNTANQVTRVVTVGPDVTKPVVTILGSSPIDVEAGTSYSDAGAIASDNVDTNLEIVVGGDIVDVNTLGKYVITYSAQDAAGNYAEKRRRAVNVVDTQKPTISLVGFATMNVEVGTAFSDPGATANDAFEGNITDDIVVSGSVNINAVGVYVLTYNVSDSSGNAATQVTRTVNVTSDATKPIINLLGDASITIEVGDSYDDSGATASDNIDGVITSDIVVVSNVNTSVLGDYRVTYNVVDEAGNAADEVSRTVSVVDTTKPSIVILGSDPVDLELGDVYVDLGAIASDNYDSSVSLIVGGDTVNTFIEGSYTITYDAIDSSGNNADQVTRTINVGPDETIPVITLLGSTNLTLEVGSDYVDPNATAIDNIDGNITANIVVDSSALNTALLGQYTVTYNVSDDAGNAAVEKTRIVDVVDTTKPVINLIGNNPLNIEIGSTFVDPGFTATDNYDGNVFSDVTVDASDVDTSTVGAYNVTYNVEDASGNKADEVIRTVNVTPDAVVPVISLIGNTTLQIELYSTFNDPGASALDNIDGDITDNIVVSGDVDVTAEGIYELQYNVQDAAGNRAVTVRRTVAVDESTDSIIARNKIISVAGSGDASSVTIDDLNTINGVDNVIADNQAAYQAAIAAANVSDVDTVEEIIALVDSVNSQQAVLAAVNSGDTSSITAELLNTIIGVEGALVANEALYQAAIAAADPEDVDTAEELQALINSINAMQEVQAAANGGDASGITVDELNAIIGVDGALAENEAAYQAAISAAALADVDTPEEIQALIDQVNSEQALLEVANAAGGDASGVSIDDLNNIIGLNNVDGDNEAAYQAAISAATPGSLSTLADIQALIDTVNSDEVLSAISNAIGGDASGITAEDLNTIDGVSGALPENEALYQAAIEAAAPGELDTPAQIQAMIDAINASQAALAEIKDAAGGDASGITIDDLNAIIGLENVDAGNEAAYQAAIASASADEVDTLEEIQALIDAVNASEAAIAAIQAAADSDDASGISLDDLNAIIGLSGINDDNLAYYQTAIADSDSATLIDASAIQSLLDDVNTQAALDTDGDGLNNFIDNDDDGDLLPDALDPNDQNPDTDGDGITDGADADLDNDGTIDNGPDSDNDGINDAADANGSLVNDLDGDGIVNDYDNDADGDGLIKDRDADDLNPDQDGDGIPDGADSDINGDGLIDNGPDTDLDGINDAADADVNGDGVIDNGTDFDGDGINDLIDQDDDNDGLIDTLDPDSNNPDVDGDGIPDGADSDINGDGIIDNGPDTDGDGIRDEADADVDGDGIPDNGTDTDGDGIIDELDNDDDGDGVPDAVDTNPTNPDTDGDGILDNVDADVDGDGTIDNGPDSDGDGIRDDADADSDENAIDLDGDGVIDGVDMNGDGILTGDELLNFIKDLDFDNDGILNLAEYDVNGDGIADDSDSDGIPDIYDADSFNNAATSDGSGDSDNDEATDLEECSSFPNCDSDGNKVFDHLDNSLAKSNNMAEVEIGAGSSVSNMALYLLLPLLLLSAVRNKQTGVVVMCLAILGQAQANDMSFNENGFYLGTGFGSSIIKPEVSGNFDFPDEQGVGVNVFAGYILNERWSVDLMYADLGEAQLVDTTTQQIEGEIEYNTLALSGLFHFEMSQNSCGRYCEYDPFVGVGLSYLDTDHDITTVNVDQESSQQASFSLGTDYYIKRDWNIRLMATQFSEGTALFSAGLSKHFGDTKKSKANEPVVREVYIQAPPVQYQPQVAQPQVDNSCRPKAGDNLNSCDCEQFNGRFSGINFGRNSSELKSESFAKLDHLAKALHEYDDMKILIQAHADSRGDELRNWQLTQERADKVMAYLIERGIDPVRLVSMGAGSTKPLYDNATDYGRAMNRRVEFIVLQ